MSRRVEEWQHRLKPKLELEDQRESFDIHKYGQRVLDSAKALNGGTVVSEPVDFEELLRAAWL